MRAKASSRNDGKVIALKSARDNDNARTQLPQPMAASNKVPGAGTTENNRSALQATAMDCGELIPNVARLIWPDKTAAHWATAAGRQQRIAEYWLANRWNAQAREAILRYLLNIRPPD